MSAAPADGPVQVEFSDGIVVAATLSGTHLSLAGYRTASGTRIDARRWRLTFDRQPGKSGFRVAGRAAP